MAERRIQIKDITSVGADKPATIKLITGLTYKDITLVVGNSAAGDALAPVAASTHVGEIRVLFGTEIVRRVSAARLDVINTANGANYASQGYAGVANGSGRRHIPIFFFEPWRTRMSKDSVNLDKLSWQTKWLGSDKDFKIEVDLITGTPVLAAFATVEDEDDGGRRPIMKWNTYAKPAVGTPIELTNPVDRTDVYSQWSIFDTSDAKTIDHVKLVVNQGMGDVEHFNRTKDENTTDLKKAGMNPAAGAYHIVWDQNDALEQLMPGNSGTQLTLTPSAAANGTVPIVTQRLSLPAA